MNKVHRNKYNSILDYNSFVPFDEYIPVCIPENVKIGNKNYKKGEIIMLNLSQQKIVKRAKSRAGRSWQSIVEVLLTKCKNEDGSISSDKVQDSFKISPSSAGVYIKVVETAITLAQLVEQKKNKEARELLDSQKATYRKLIPDCLAAHSIVI